MNAGLSIKLNGYMKRIFILFLIAFTINSCSNDGPSGPNPDDFDRKAILINWADNIIIPAFTELGRTTSSLHISAQNFSNDPTLQNFEVLRNNWKTAYLAFQHVSMFEMGKSMELRYRDNLNIYPTDVSEIEENIETGNYNLELPSLNNSQGFPALDYLLNGLGDNEDQVISYYTTNSNAESYKTYLTDLTSRIDNMTIQVLEHWQSSFRDEFINNSGNGANSSLDMMVNDYIYYYEKHLRAGKVGIPAGVFSGTPLSTHTEAYYSDDLSKSLLKESLIATQNFFNGIHFQSNEDGQSLDEYLDYLNTIKDGADLTTIINEQFDAAESVIEGLNGNFAEQVESDNSLMLASYDELQKNVVNLKVDMLQALNVNVDYVDADGD